MSSPHRYQLVDVTDLTDVITVHKLLLPHDNGRIVVLTDRWLR